jgi:hypothetical protein
VRLVVEVKERGSWVDFVMWSREERVEAWGQLDGVDWVEVKKLGVGFE